MWWLLDYLVCCLDLFVIWLRVVFRFVVCFNFVNSVVIETFDMFGFLFVVLLYSCLFCCFVVCFRWLVIVALRVWVFVI